MFVIYQTTKLMVLFVRIPSGYVGVLKKTGSLFRKNQDFPGISLNINDLGIIPEVYIETQRVFKFPKWHYELIFHPITVVPEGEIGLVIAKYGKPKQQGSKLSLSVECNGFLDARAFFLNNGQMGAQSDYINEGDHKINLEIFKIITSETLSLDKEGLSPSDFKPYFISGNQIGIVTTEDGKPLEEEQIAGERIEGHNKFTNATSFLRNGGFRGLQEEIISSGSWSINPWFAKVVLRDLIQIPVDKVGVITSSFGKSANYSSEIESIINNERNSLNYYASIRKMFDENKIEEAYENIKNMVDETYSSKDFEKLQSFLVDDGYRGVQKKILDTGKHKINTEIYKVETVPTNQIILEWNDRLKEPDRWDYNLKAISIFSKDRHILKLEVRHTFRIPKDKAPIMVLTVGAERYDGENMPIVKSAAIKNLVTKVFSSTIENEFLAAAAANDGIDFIDETRSEIQAAINAKIKAALKFHGVLGIETAFTVIELPKELQEELDMKKAQKLKEEKMKHNKEEKKLEIQYAIEIEEQQRTLTEYKLKTEYFEKLEREVQEINLEDISSRTKMLKLTHELERELQKTENGVKIMELVTKQKRFESELELEIFLKKLKAEGGPEAKIMMKFMENFYKLKLVPDIQFGNTDESGLNYYGSPTNTLLRTIIGKLSGKFDFEKLGEGTKYLEDKTDEIEPNEDDNGSNKKKLKTKSKPNEIGQTDTYPHRLSLAKIDLITEYQFEDNIQNSEKAEHIILMIGGILNDYKIDLIDIRPGSLIFTLQMDEKSAENLFIFVKLGLLKDLKVVDIIFSNMGDSDCSEIITKIGINNIEFFVLKKCLKRIILKDNGIHTAFIEVSKILHDGSHLHNMIIPLQKRLLLINDHNTKGISSTESYFRDITSIVSSLCSVIDSISESDVLIKTHQ